MLPQPRLSDFPDRQNAADESYDLQITAEKKGKQTLSYVWFGPPPIDFEHNQKKKITFGPCFNIMSLLSDTGTHVRLVVDAADVDYEAAIQQWEYLYYRQVIKVPVISARCLFAAAMKSLNPANFSSYHALAPYTDFICVLFQRGSSFKHTTLKVTGKELLAFIVRYLLGGFTADTSVLPLSTNYTSEWTVESPWEIPSIVDGDKAIANKIAYGLAVIAQHRHSAAPTKGYDCGGQSEGAYFICSSLNSAGYVVITNPLNWQSVFTDFRVVRELENLDMVDIYFNYAQKHYIGTIEALKVYLTFLKKTAEGHGEIAENYNMMRSVGVLSAAMTEQIFDFIQNPAQSFRFGFPAYPTILPKRSFDSTEPPFQLFSNASYIIGRGISFIGIWHAFRESRPHKSEEVGGGNFILHPDIGLVKYTTQSWAKGEHLPTTPRH